MLTGDKGNSSDVKKSRTFSGALCSENHEVPGSESSSALSSSSESESSLECGSFSVGWFLVERWERVRA